jgi:hypothetical protein
MTFNVHILLHACDCVSRWGPLWAYSAYGFEDSNGRLGKLFNGTQAVDLQLANKFLKIQNLKSIGIKLIDQLLDNELLTELVQKLLGVIPNLKRHFTVVGQCSFLGSSRQTYLNEEEFLTLEKELRFVYNGFCPNDSVLCDTFEKMCTKKDLFSTVNHKKSTKRKNCFVTTINGEIHELVTFHVPRSTERIPQTYLIYSRRLKFHKIISSLNMHLVQIDEHGSLVLLSPLTIKCKCIVIQETPILTLAVLSNLIDRD